MKERCFILEKGNPRPVEVDRKFRVTGKFHAVLLHADGKISILQGSQVIANMMEIVLPVSKLPALRAAFRMIENDIEEAHASECDIADANERNLFDDFLGGED